MDQRACVRAMIVMLALAGGPAPALAGDEPDRVTVQHILIGFKKTIGKKLERTKAEARTLAAELLERAEKGEDFEALVKEYSDDTRSTYSVTNTDEPLRSGHQARGSLAVRFGDVAFSLELGEVGMARYHAALSPYGWHIIKRVE